MSRVAALVILAGCGLGHPGFEPDAPTVVGDAAGFTNGMSTLAGSSDAGKIDGDRSVARFNNPVNVAFGPDGKVYVADFDNSLIRAVDLQGNVTTLVDQKNFVRPFGMAFGNGTLYVSTDNDVMGAHSPLSGSVWKVDISTGVATILVNAIGRPRGIVWLPNSQQLALVDDLHHVVRLMNPTTGAISNLAGTWDAVGYADGNGAAARFSTPYGVAVRGDGNLVVVDQMNNRLRVVGMDGNVSTLAGSGDGYGDGAMTSAKFNRPQAITADGNGNMYVSDTMNYRIRKITADGVSTLALDGKAGWKDSDDLMAAEAYGLEGMAVSSDGTTLFVADGNRGEEKYAFNRVRMIDIPH